jgi:outer membrane protein assembly factor BamA
MTKRVVGAWLIVFACASVASVAAQEPASGDATAAPGRLSRAVAWTEAKADGAAGAPDGFYPEFGGLIGGSGASVGPGYRRYLSRDRLLVDVSGAVSWRRYQMLQGHIEWPRGIGERVSLGANVKYQDFTQINFFGVGSDTLKADQTDYRLKYLDAGGFGTLHAKSWLTVTGRAGVMRRADISRGTSTLHPSTEERFDEQSAPGLTNQPNYVHADLAIEADTRDAPGYPSSGGRYRASLAAFHDRDFSRYSFRRVEIEAAHYLPITGHSVAAIRGRVDVSQTAAGQQVPFFLLPALGGTQTLRGYSDYRFRDRDLLLVNAEYRWRVARALDAAIFYDAGAVAPAAAAVSMSTWKKDYGVGVRMHSKTHLLMRLDVARGNEGTRAAVSFTPPLSFSRRSVAPYVP